MNLPGSDNTAILKIWILLNQMLNVFFDVSTKITIQLFLKIILTALIKMVGHEVGIIR